MLRGIGNLKTVLYNNFINNKLPNSMNVIIGLCHSYSGKVVTFQESFFACKRKT